jgi:FkbH-like protein
MTESETSRSEQEPVKCVVWDLDQTLWLGTLLEGDRPEIPARNRDLVCVLDDHGILQSIASRNDEQAALTELAAQGMAEYFLYPQIGWGAKSAAVRRIIAQLGVAARSVLFVDDNEFERAEVADRWPDMRCLTAEELHESVQAGWVLPTAVSAEARSRRELYRAEQRRSELAAAHQGPREDFLRSLGMRLVVREAVLTDLVRAAELTQRTHQLNTTGVTYDEAELAELIGSDRHVVLVAELNDGFGGYGIIGLAVVDTGPTTWTVRLLLMSCRVLGRNLGTTVVGAVVLAARARRCRVRAHFRTTERNRQMRLTYRLMGFIPDPAADDAPAGIEVLAFPETAELSVPDYVDLVTEIDTIAPAGSTVKGQQ